MREGETDRETDTDRQRERGRTFQSSRFSAVNSNFCIRGNHSRTRRGKLAMLMVTLMTVAIIVIVKTDTTMR